MRPFAQKLLPPGSRRRIYASRLLRKTGIIDSKIAIEYYDYITSLQAAQLPLYPTNLPEDITFSIVVPAYNTPDKYLKPLIRSIALQTYKNWQLILVNASDDSRATDRIQNVMKTDKRIEVIKTDNKGISANTNLGIEHATGDYVIFVDHDDLLDYGALNEIRRAIQAQPNAGLIYSDEDKVSEDGKQFSAPHFKPDWSPDLLNCVNYITHLVAVKRSLINKVGSLDPAKDGAQDYDFLLRAVDAKPEVVHIPKVLYHWRQADNSTARSLDFKPEATRAGVAALREHLERQGIRGAVVENRTDRPGFYKIVYKPAAEISIIIAPFASSRVLKQYVERLITRTATDDTTVKLIMPTGFSLDPALQKYTATLEVISVPHKNEASFLKQALDQASEHVLIINKLIFPTTKRWLNDLSGVSALSRIAAAAPVIINDTDCVSDSGYVYEGDELIRLFRGIPFEDNPTFFGNTEWCRDVNGLTGNIALMRKAAFAKFVESTNTGSVKNIIKDFSLDANQKGKDICIWSNVIFNDLTIAALPAGQTANTRGNFNSSLVTYGESFHVVSGDETIINRLALIPIEDENYE